MTKPDFATDPDIGAELDRQAKLIREERRIRDVLASSRRSPAPDEAQPLSRLLHRRRTP